MLRLKWPHLKFFWNDPISTGLLSLFMINSERFGILIDKWWTTNFVQGKKKHIVTLFLRNVQGNHLRCPFGPLINKLRELNNLHSIDSENGCLARCITHTALSLLLCEFDKLGKRLRPVHNHSMSAKDKDRIAINQSWLEKNIDVIPPSFDF